MMKKQLFTLAASSLVVMSMLTACGGSDTSNTGSSAGSAASNGTQQTAAETVTRDLPEDDYSDLGVGTMYISTPAGTSENGAVPVLFISEDDILLQIGLDTVDFDGGHLSHIYVDGMLSATEQLGESQISLDLSGDALAAGQHDVEVVQYDTDELDGQMITYKSAAYEVKLK